MLLVRSIGCLALFFARCSFLSLRFLEFGFFRGLLQVELFVVHLFVDFLCGFLAQPETTGDLEHAAQDLLESLEELLGTTAADAGAAGEEEQHEQRDREGDEVPREERTALVRRGYVDELAEDVRGVQAELFAEDFLLLFVCSQRQGEASRLKLRDW